MSIARLLLVAGASGGGGGSSSPYAATFSSSDWTTAQGKDKYEIPVTTHKKGANLIVDVWVKNGSEYQKYNGYPSTGFYVSVDSTGNVTLFADEGDSFPGKVVIL